MKYQKKYLLIKGDGETSDSIFGYVKMEKDGGIIIEYNLSVFSISVDIYLSLRNKIVKEYKNKSVTGTIKINHSDISDISFIFISNKNFYFAGKVCHELIKQVKSLFNERKDNYSLINSVLEKMFDINTKPCFYDRVKKYLDDAFMLGENFVFSNFKHDSKWVKVDHGYKTKIIGKIYSDNDLFAIAIGVKVECVNSGHDDIFTVDFESYFIQFFDIYSGERIKI